MRRGMTFRIWHLLAVLLAVAPGCGGTTTKPTDSGPSGQETVDDVAAMLKEYSEVNHHAPARIEDLTDAAGSHPVGHAAVASREYIVLWRTSKSAAGSGSVLAYQKDVPASGGFVLLQDGTVKKMTAEEFKAASKTK